MKRWCKIVFRVNVACLFLAVRFVSILVAPKLGFALKPNSHSILSHVHGLILAFICTEKLVFFGYIVFFITRLGMVLVVGMPLFMITNLICIFALKLSRLRRICSVVFLARTR